MISGILPLAALAPLARSSRGLARGARARSVAMAERRTRKRKARPVDEDDGEDLDDFAAGAALDYGDDHDDDDWQPQPRGQRGGSFLFFLLVDCATLILP